MAEGIALAYYLFDYGAFIITLRRYKKNDFFRICLEREQIWLQRGW